MTGTNFTLTEEIKSLGIESIRIDSVDTQNKEEQLFIKHKDVSDELVCPYDKKIKNVASDIEATLVKSAGMTSKQAKNLIALFTKLIVMSEQQEQQKKRDSMLQEIRKRKETSNFKDMNEWQAATEGRYNELRQIVMDNIPEMWIGLEFELSVLRILNIYGNTLPFIGILLARPGSYKTQILRLLNGWYCIYHTDDFNARSFVSHNSSFDDAELRERIDMLPQIKNKMFQTPELAPLFTAKDEDLLKNLGLVTKIADGHGYTNNSGAHGQRSYNEDIMFTWIGAVVDIPYRVYKMLGALGFKMYFFRLPYKEKTVGDILKNMDSNFNQKTDNIKAALFEYLYTFEMGPELVYDNELNKMPWNDMKNDPVAKEFIAHLAMLLQYLRCIVITWDDKGDGPTSEYGYHVSMPEDPERAAKALFNLAKGHALLTGRNYITLEDVPIVVKTVLSTAQIDRVGLLYLLIEHSDQLSTDDIMDALHVARSTALRTMKEFEVIGLVETFKKPKYEEDGTKYTHYITLRKEFKWLLQDAFTKLREGFKPVDSRRFLMENKKQKDNFTNSPPHTRRNDFTPEQVDTFLSIFDAMEKEQAAVNYPAEIDRDTVSGENLKQRLVESGKFNDLDEAAMIIVDMQNHRMIELVSRDTYRRSRK